MRVLVVEDNPLVGLMVVDELADAGHDVIGPERSFQSALKALDGEECDCALIDIDLADGRTGPALAAKLSEERGVTAIFISGQSELAQTARDGAVGLLGKPVDPHVLLETIRCVAALRAGEDPQFPPGFTDLRDRDALAREPKRAAD